MRQPAITYSLTPIAKSAVMMRAPSGSVLPLSQLHSMPVKTSVPSVACLHREHVPAMQEQHTIEHNTKAQFDLRGVCADTKRLNMYIIIDTKWVTALRHLVVNTFGNSVLSIGIQPIDHARKMKVCLSFHGKNAQNTIDKSIEERFMTAIMRTLPSAEFGRIRSA